MILKRVEAGNLIKAIYDSSNVVASTYDNSNNEMTIIFKSGKQYKYIGVSKADYFRFEIGESQGKVFNTHIKKYTFEQLGDVDTVKIITEVDKLKNAENNALLEGKRMKILFNIKDVIVINDNQPFDNERFVEALKKLEITIKDYL